MLDITIIADNGGGLTLQLTNDNGERYQHYYESAVQCARDVKAALDDTFADWDGNEAEEDEDGTPRWMNVTYEDIRRGGYRELTVADLDALDPETCSWNNIRELVGAYRALKS